MSLIFSAATKLKFWLENITQSELCSITRISENYLGALENNKREISLEVASKRVVF